MKGILRAGRLENEGVLLIFLARQGKLFPSPHPALVPFRDVEGATGKGEKNKVMTVWGKGLQTCQSVLVLSESNPDWLGNDYLRWMISAYGLK